MDNADPSNCDGKSTFQIIQTVKTTSNIQKIGDVTKHNYTDMINKSIFQTH